MATLALFDFDHTLYRKDSLLEFTRFHHGKSFYWGMLLLSPFLIGLKIGILNNEQVKLRYFKYFFGDIDHAAFMVSAAKFAHQNIDHDIDQHIFAKFHVHLAAGDQVYIVTASAPDWIQPWSDKYGVQVIGTKLQTQNGRLTGHFSTRNCHGPQKVHRIAEIIDVNAFDRVYVYGSGAGDREMLKLAKLPE